MTLRNPRPLDISFKVSILFQFARWASAVAF